MFVAAIALAWTGTQLEIDALVSAAERVSAAAFASAVGLGLLGITLGAVRWRVLLESYGAQTIPPIGFLLRAYLVGIFYNTFLPANVGGDLVRGHVTRRSFEGIAGAYLIVAIERLFGLAGLLLLGAIVLMVRPLATGVDLRLLAAGGIAAALVAVALPLVGRGIGIWIPGRIGTILQSLPQVKRPTLLGVVLALSVSTQLSVALSGHVLLSSIRPTLPLSDSLVLVPLAMAALYLPTIAGLGVREAAFVFFFGVVEVPPAEATAASLALFAAQLLLALGGGALHAVAPLTATPTNGDDSSRDDR